METQKKINYCHFSLDKFYRHTRGFTDKELSLYIQAYVEYMETGNCPSNAQAMLSKYLSRDIIKDFEFLRQRALTIINKAQNAANERWHSKKDIPEQCTSIVLADANINSNTNINKNKKINKEIQVRDTQALRLTQLLFDSIMANLNPTKFRNNPPKLDKWYEDVEMLHRIDGCTYDQIEAVIVFATKDSFWKANILSGKKLREKFTQLEAKMKQTTGQTWQRQGDGLTFEQARKIAEEM